MHYLGHPQPSPSGARALFLSGGDLCLPPVRRNGCSGCLCLSPSTTFFVPDSPWSLFCSTKTWSSLENPSFHEHLLASRGIRAALLTASLVKPGATFPSWRVFGKSWSLFRTCGQNTRAQAFHTAHLRRSPASLTCVAPAVSYCPSLSVGTVASSDQRSGRTLYLLLHDLTPKG